MTAPVPTLDRQPEQVAPRISLVVAVRDEEATLPALLATIGAQTLPPEQVVLVDGGSTDDTVAVARRLTAGDDRYLVVEAGPATPGRGRNVGFRAARNDWVAITDAGIRLEPTWLERLWEAHLADPDSEVVYGNYEFDTRSFYEECAATTYGSAKRETPLGRIRGPMVFSSLVRRRAFELVGGFPDLRAAEDEMFIRALREAGVRHTWAPGATVWWRLRTTPAATLERFRLYSYHNVLAGQEEHWQRPLARSYVPAGVGLVLAAGSSRRWLVLPAAVVGARVAKRVRKHAVDTGLAAQVAPRRLAVVTLLLLATDAATAVGWWQAVRERRRAPASGSRAGG